MRLAAHTILNCLALSFILSLPVAFAQSNPDFFPYLGISLNNNFVIVDTYLASPADRAGLLSGDRIVSIGSSSVGNLDHARTLSLLRGELGAPVSLIVSRGTRTFAVTLIHEIMKPNTPKRSHSEFPQDTPSGLFAPAKPSANEINIDSFSSSLDSLDRQMVVVTDKTELTESVVNALARGLALLPQSIKQRFIDFGVKVLVTPTLAALTGDMGSCRYDIGNKRVIICERDANATRVDIQRMHITLLHELGHAYDHMMGYPSRKSEFREVYDSEAPGVPPQHREILSHFLQEGQKGSSECFASLFACIYYRGADRRLNALVSDFPRSLALMRRYVEND